MSRSVAIVLAAGKGTRMHSDLPKVLHPVGGSPMIIRVLTAVRDARIPAAVVVTGYGAEAIRETVDHASSVLAPLCIAYAYQPTQRGTGDAVRVGIERLDPEDCAVIVPGDTPLLEGGVLRSLLDQHRDGVALTLMTARVADPFGYGRIVRDGCRVTAIVEQRDASTEQQRITEVNTGVMCVSVGLLRQVLPLCRSDNAQGEILLTDIVGILADRGAMVQSMLVDDPDVVMGVNDSASLARCEALVASRRSEATPIQETLGSALDGRNRTAGAGAWGDGPERI